MTRLKQIAKIIIMKYFILICIFLILDMYLYGQRNKFEGNYISNFSELGFFKIQLLLNNDYTFSYQASGDMIHDEGTGIYKINRDTIICNFRKD